MAFEYTTEFPVADPHSPSAFKRSFKHKDWKDGEDVVQADETSNDKGFNWRFHKIEKDLDALGHSFESIAEVRRSLRALLDEIRDEINRPWVVANQAVAILQGTAQAAVNAAMGPFGGEIGPPFLPPDNRENPKHTALHHTLIQYSALIMSACSQRQQIELPKRVSAPVKAKWLICAVHFWQTVIARSEFPYDVHVIVNSYLADMLGFLEYEDSRGH